MNFNLARFALFLGGVVAVSFIGSRPAVADLDVYMSRPADVTSLFSNIQVETFDSSSLSVGNRTTPYVGTIGTYQASNTSKMAIVADNQYGSGTSNYMSIGAQSGTSAPLTLNLNSAQSYFGFSWNAGDKNNGVTFYNGNQLIGRFATADVLTVLSKTKVTAIDGTVYNSVDYYGKWNGNNPKTQNMGEPYVFLNFISTNGTFDKIVFDNSGTTSTGFETDNHTVRAVAPTAHGSFVRIGSVPLPEPGSFALIGTLAPLVFVGLRRRRKIN